MSHFRYACLLAGSAFCLTLALAIFGHGFEPLYGDLTRIGWRSENDFGWTRPEEHFSPLAAHRGEIDRHYDLVAIGDSFTDESDERPGTTWPHYLAAATGLNVAIFASDDGLLDRLLASPGFQRDPPAAIIYEIVERQLIPNHRPLNGAGCSATATATAPALALKPPLPAPIPVMRPRAHPFYDWPAAYGAAWIVQNLRRILIGHESSSSVLLELTRGDLFSSRRSTALLVYAEDFNKINWHDADWRAAGCSLINLQNRVEANGRTRFLVMIAPDKLTAYGPFLADRAFRGLSRLDLVADIPGLHLVRLDRDFDPTRYPDLYMPDDTHWSSTGHRLAAAHVLTNLLQMGVVRPAAAE